MILQGLLARGGASTRGAKRLPLTLTKAARRHAVPCRGEAHKKGAQCCHLSESCASHTLISASPKLSTMTIAHATGTDSESTAPH